MFAPPKTVSKVVCIEKPNCHRSLPGLDPAIEIVRVNTPAEALLAMQDERVTSLWAIKGDESNDSDPLRSLIETARRFDQLPVGVAVLDAENRVLQANQQLKTWFGTPDMVGQRFYEAIGDPKIIGPEPSPIAKALSTQTACRTTIERENQYYRLHVVPIASSQEPPQLIVTVVDCTESVLQRRKLTALHQAGTELADLRPDEIHLMDLDQRIDLLKDNIQHFAKDLLDFDVIEIRLLDETTGLLKPLLSVGIDSDNANRPIYARQTGNGVTGFVAATGNSYVCEDTSCDPLYLAGLTNARSSLTVPLIYDDRVIGSFNVESPELNAYNDSDVEFVKAFASDIAVALNTLELLSAQQSNTALQSVEAIHAAVALPIDVILNDAVLALDQYVGRDEEVKQRLRDILHRAREIKQVIQKVGRQVASTSGVPSAVQTDARPKLQGKRVLVIDTSDEIRASAHELLEPYGIIVETAHEGRKALLLVNNTTPENAYDAIIADIKLPDINGYELLMQLQAIINDPPLILMTGYGYDPGHSIVKARQAGLRANAVLGKPFRIEPLLDTIEATIEASH